MNATVATVLAVILAYLLGSIPFAILVSHAAGIADPRSFGSGNPGATNVLRSGHRGAAAATLFLDAFKGWVAVRLVMEFGWRFGIDDSGVAAVALAVFVGHLYPVFFGFRGGKGVATALGILAAVAWWLGLATAMTWVVIAVFLRYSSLAALIAAIFAPFYYALLVGFDPIGGAILVMSALVVYRHRGNIAKLLAGTETRIGAKKDPQDTREVVRKRARAVR